VTDLASADDVTRLFGRAAFGATGEIRNQWQGRPYNEVVASLFPPGPPGTSGRLPFSDEGTRAEYEHQTNDVAGAQRWWLERMRTTPYPLEERMTLFWHDHFATAYTGQPDVGQLVIQNQAIRMNALGSFRALANAMGVDPAMLVWLNGIANRLGGVNENYAREFFELFTLGVRPQVYTETDIRQAARSFTGFTVNTTTRAATFTATRHDPSAKQVLGRTVGGYPSADARNAVEYAEITEAALAHNFGITCSRFLAYKLVLEFGYTPDESNLDADVLIQDVAWAIRAGDRWDIKAGVATLLTHPLWRYADRTTSHDLVRSPAEVAVHGAKILGVNLNVSGGGLQAQPLNAATQRAGQALFVPPNVGGWPTGANWLSQSTTLARYDMLNTLILAYRQQYRDKVVSMPPSGDIPAWAWYMGLGTLSTSTTLRLREFLAGPGTTAEADKQAGMFILLGASPDWQVM
jgi:uncharacterized protein (DUF1800 family)